MANQTELLNVSDEMKLNDKKQIIEGQEHDKELYSSSEPDACGDGMSFVQTKTLSGPKRCRNGRNARLGKACECGTFSMPL